MKISGSLSRKIARKSSIHSLPALAKFSPRLPGSCATFLTSNGPIPTLVRSFFDENVDFFDLGEHFFSIFRRQFLIISRYFYSFSAPKSGVQSIPRVIAVLMVFFSSKTDKISPNFDHFFARNPLFPIVKS